MPPVSNVRLKTIANTGAAVLVQKLVATNIFSTQPAQFLTTLMDIAAAADSAVTTVA